MLPEALFLNVHMYGIMVSVGILCAFGVLYLYGKKLQIERAFVDFIFYDSLASVVVGMGSAALFQGLYDYIKDPSLGFRLGGGITFIGGMIGGSICFLLIYFVFRKKLTARLTEIVSLLPCCITVAHAPGRIGCFFAGCCYGKETECFLGVKFPNLSDPVHPTQLYEAAFLFLLFTLASYLLLKKKFWGNMSLYLIGYGIFRFLIEFIRGDERGKLIGTLTPSQFWALIMIALGAVLIPIMYKKHKTYKEHA
ncbi:MAG: prolipoprotein diacylglyceryl transferase [Clostridia bacterium]|nr:prolipoprotein diacylglyceryl transferase [Clostridia bacterium]MBR6726321.1 prolipoprotein diacylglyceryl transferase [Clostridia bacterium]